MSQKTKIRKTACSCYDHLGGKLGETLFKLLITKQWISKVPNRSKYLITEAGWEGLRQLGVDTGQLKSSSRIPVSPCTEQCG